MSKNAYPSLIFKRLKIMVSTIAQIITMRTCIFVFKDFIKLMQFVATKTEESKECERCSISAPNEDL